MPPKRRNDEDEYKVTTRTRSSKEVPEEMNTVV